MTRTNDGWDCARSNLVDLQAFLLPAEEHQAILALCYRIGDESKTRGFPY
jgi:hypothetical protein